MIQQKQFDFIQGMRLDNLEYGEVFQHTQGNVLERMSD